MDEVRFQEIRQHHLGQLKNQKTGDRLEPKQLHHKSAKPLDFCQDTLQKPPLTSLLLMAQLLAQMQNNF